jgi:uncharacterized membrane protein
MKDMKAFILKPEGLFMTLSILFGVLFVFLVPPMQTPDENSHFYQAYSVSNLKILPEKFVENGKTKFGAKIPKSVSTAAETLKASVAGKPDISFDEHLLKQFINQPLELRNTQYQTGAALYAPVVYIPQAIGITVGKIFNSSPLVMMWLARLANLALWVSLIYLAIKLIPVAKWAMVVLALNPMAVFLSASLSADVMTTALVFLLFSIVTMWFVKNEAITYRWTAIIIGLLGLIALTKQINVLFALLLFAIPWQRFKSIRNYLIFCIGGTVLAVGIGVLWTFAISEPSHASAQAMRPGVVIAPAEQLAGILHHPAGYVRTLVANYIIVSPGYPGDSVFRSFFGTFGWFDTTIPLWTIVLYTFGLLLALGFQLGRDIVVPIRQKLILLAIFVLAAVGNITAMYVFFTPVGAHIIEGVQGRYFIPASILLIALFTARKKLLFVKEKTLASVLLVTVSIVLVSSIATIIGRYYY